MEIVLIFCPKGLIIKENREVSFMSMAIGSIGMGYRMPNWSHSQNAAQSKSALPKNWEAGASAESLKKDGGTLAATAREEQSPSSAVQRKSDTGECETCKNRKYQDGSDDPGVSYKTPTTIDADMANAAVRSHEQEHVGREQFQAEQEGREVVFQTVTIHNAICPECGRIYVSGGTTRTVTKEQVEQVAAKYQVGKPEADQSGKTLAVA